MSSLTLHRHLHTPLAAKPIGSRDQIEASLALMMIQVQIELLAFVSKAHVDAR